MTLINPIAICDVDLVSKRLLPRNDAEDRCLVLCRAGATPISTNLLADASLKSTVVPDLRVTNAEVFARELLQRAMEQGLPPAGFTIEDLAAAALSSSTPSAPRARVTACVCTTGTRASLLECLARLRKHAPRFPLLVVHNGTSNEDLKATIKGLVPNAEYVTAERPGLSHARNVALRRAASEFIAFIDDDVLVDEAWADSIEECLVDDPDLACVTGLVMPAALRLPPQIWFEDYAGFGRGFVDQWWQSRLSFARDPTLQFRTWEIGTGACMILNRESINRIGGFDPALGTGTLVGGAEDLHAFYRLLRHGYEVRYNPRIVVWHIHRSSKRELVDQIRSFGAVACMLQAIAHAEPRKAPSILRMIPFMLRYFAWRLRTRVGKYGTIPMFLVFAEILGYCSAIFGRHYAKSQAINGSVEPGQGFAKSDPPNDQEIELDLCRPIDGIRVAPPCNLTIRISIRSRHLGRISLRSHTRHVSPFRIRRTVVEEFGSQLLSDQNSALDSRRLCELVFDEIDRKVGSHTVERYVPSEVKT